MANKISFHLCCDCYKPDKRELRKLISAVLKRHCIKNAAIEILIGSDDIVKQNNMKHLGHHYTTDVISFNLSDEFSDEKVFNIIVNAQMAQEQARQRGHSHNAELALYICHGLLHNLGYDDNTKANSAKMHLEEDTILQSVGFGVVYNNR